MPRAHAITHQREISTYHRLVRRVNRSLINPSVLHRRQAVLRPAPEDRPEDWERLVDEIEQTEGARLDRRPDGSVCVCWARPGAC